MHKLSFIAVFCLLLGSTLTVHAQSPDLTDNLKKRLQDSLTATPSSITPLNQFRGYIGVIKDVISSTLIVEHKDGKLDIKVSDETTILRAPGNTPIKASNINIGDYIIAIGTIDTDEIISGHRLIVSANPFTPPAKVSALATIKKITKSALTLTIGDKDQTVATTSKTITKTPTGSIELTDLEVGDTIIYTAAVDKESQTATIIMRIKTSSLE